MTTPNEELRARLPELPEPAYIDESEDASGALIREGFYSAEQLQDYAIAALARQEEGREAVTISTDSVAQCSRDTQAATGAPVGEQRRQARAQVRTLPESTVYTHPAPPSAGEGDALRGSSECPICANSSPHQHTGVEVAEYRVATTNALVRIQQLPDVYADFRAWADQHMPHNPRGWETWLAAHDRYSATPTPQSGEADDPVFYRNPRQLHSIVPAPASPQGVSEAVVDSVRADITSRAADDGHTHIALKDEWVRAALEAVWPTAAGAAPEGCITVQRGAVNALLQFGTCHEMSSEAELHTYVEARDLLLNMLAATPNPGAQHGQEGR